jgi:hypothetical protein
VARYTVSGAPDTSFGEHGKVIGFLKEGYVGGLAGRVALVACHQCVP